ncbi:MAG TPA: putative lipid II flippase FtsW [Actinomycetota bacterium]|nr:putative lipid II flippase FtsW [Actinomycetota bacterium]
MPSTTATRRSTPKTSRRAAKRVPVKKRSQKTRLRVVRPEERPPQRRPASRAAVAPDRAVAILLVATASLLLIGVAMVLSASSVSAFDRFGSSFLFFNRQVAYAAAGVAVGALTARMRYRAWERLCGPALLGAVILLALVLHPAVGTRAGGSSRWLAAGPVTLQPSEFAKLAVVAFVGAVLAKRWKRIHDARSLALPLVPVVAVVCALILLQPDLGTAVIVGGTVFAMLFVAGARLKHLVLGGGATLALGFGAIYAEGYRWARFVSFTDPWADPQGNGYQAMQSFIGLGSGGLFGVGLGASRQKWLTLPNAHTDFIYSIIGEELGLLGALVVLALFGMFVYAGIRIAVRAPDMFGRLLAAGITAWIGLQAVVNLGAVTGLLPITGVPLPFVSFGGSSLVVSLAAVGVLVSVGRMRSGSSRPRARSSG